MEKVELKSCPNPWCEGDHETDVQVRTCRGTSSGTLRSAWVECACCDLEGPTRPTVAEAVTGWNSRIEATRANDEEIARYREAMERAIEIIDRNLYHQREKVEDAKLVLRRALGASNA